MKLSLLKNFSAIVSIGLHICLLLIILFSLHGKSTQPEQKYIEIGFGGTIENNSTGSSGHNSAVNRKASTPPASPKINPQSLLKKKEVKIKPTKIKPSDNNSDKLSAINKTVPPSSNTTGSSSSSGTGSGNNEDGNGAGTGNGHGEPKKGIIVNNDIYYVVADQMPVPIGGKESITAKTSYPEAAKAANISGTVYVLAFIDENGIVKKILLIKGIGYDCDQSAERAVAETQFEPGKKHGVPVKVQMTIAVNFGPDRHQ